MIIVRFKFYLSYYVKIYNKQVQYYETNNHYIVKNTLLIKLTGGGLAPLAPMTRRLWVYVPVATSQGERCTVNIALGELPSL